MVRLAPQGQEFLLSDGTRLKNVRDLYDVLKDMDRTEFHRFVHDGKHDFASWIEHSLNDKFLAALARRAKTQRLLRKVLFIALFR